MFCHRLGEIIYKSPNNLQVSLPLLSDGQTASTQQAMTFTDYSPPQGELLMEHCPAGRAGPPAAVQSPAWLLGGSCSLL